MNFILVGTLILIDQITKYWAVKILKPQGNLEILPGILNFTYLENKGAAFGILENWRWLFIIFTIFTLCFMVFILFFKKSNSKLFKISAILIISGGIGNLLDRIFRGYVIDYISFNFFSPVCNFADYCVSLGVALLIVYILFLLEKDKLFEK